MNKGCVLAQTSLRTLNYLLVLLCVYTNTKLKKEMKYGNIVYIYKTFTQIYMNNGVYI